MDDLNRIVFFNTSWMDAYQGPAPAAHGGGWVKTHGYGGEMFNFQPFQSRIYGYVEPGDGRRIDITRLGARRSAGSVSGILVIWVARHKDKSETVVVGWYKNAKVYREAQVLPGCLYRTDPQGNAVPYRVEAEPEGSLLIPPDKRGFRIFRTAEVKKHAPTYLERPGGIGRSHIYYGQDWYGNQVKPKVLQYIAGHK